MMPAMRLCDIVCLTLLNLIIVICCKACNTTEYDVDGVCCLMCAPGHRVLKHCGKNSETVCILCTGSTYTDVPNGLTACLSCTVCDEGNGLRVKNKCSYNSDALCEPLPGHYCIVTHGESCRKAREHSTCLPGQYINQTGTALKDTVCKDCSEETYSNGSLMYCEPHTNCESLEQITVTWGTPSSDAVCTHKPSGPHLGLIIGVLLSLILLIVILSVLLCKNTRKFNIL
ncbi:tumor necrosis factor receptor superfamily member 14-like isoform X2 [Ictalurus furcatus]|uniref:tumor necrosis factor receptor superfamily member 14-like isoform X2 n=1 Tax=Ictalurus furcatus TaxID=66913 RepID=UPI002350DFD0|nr:tumor necrosis factor receptor superfamily member 14-like isoform X2 [Ictalurus furcatus]